MTRKAGGSAQKAVAASTTQERPGLDVWSDKIESWMALPSVRGGMALAALSVVVALYFVAGLEIAVLTMSGIALLLVIWLMWLSLQSLAGETPLSLEEAIGLSAPSAEEERKQSVLRALKDLEYERSVGKISEADYHDLSTRYRDEAKALMRSLAEGNSQDRSRVEDVLAERLASLGPAPKPSVDEDEEETVDDDSTVDDESTVDDQRPEARRASDDEAPKEPPADVAEKAGAEDDAVDEPAPKPDAKAAKPQSAEKAAPTRKCPECSTRNDLDAQFCKRCGHRMALEQQVLCKACPAVYDRTEKTCPACGVDQESQ